jgi:hypothetical protein
MSIRVKHYKALRGLLSAPFHPKLIALAMWVTARLSDVVFTSGYRKGDKGVHGQVPCRGLDIRSWIYPDPQMICDDINKHWIYDPERPDKKCAIYHNVGKGFHIHLQVHARTEYVGYRPNEEV